MNKIKQKLFPLHEACLSGDLQTVKKLIANNADVNLKDDNKNTPLYLACQNGHTEIADLLLRNNANPNIKIQDKNKPYSHGESYLHDVCYRDYKEIAALLLKYGAEVNAKDLNGNTALHIACEKKRTELVELLFTYGAEVNLQNTSYGATPLHAACSFNNETIVKELIAKGADLEIQNNKGKTPLDIAKKNKHTVLVKFLEQTIEEKKYKLLSEIERIPRDVQKLIFNLLPEKDQNHFRVLNKRFYQLFTNLNESLYFACKNGFKALAELSITQGAQVNLLDDEGNTPLYIAYQNGHIEIARLLLQNKANPNIKIQDKNKLYSHGESYLHEACYLNNQKIVFLLLKYGAEVNAKGPNGNTALHIAFEEGHIELVKLLLNYHFFNVKNEIDVNVKNNLGNTPLHLACRFNNLEILKILVEDYQVDVKVENKKKKTPLDIAKEKGHTVLVTFLEEKIKEKENKDFEKTLSPKGTLTSSLMEKFNIRTAEHSQQTPAQSPPLSPPPTPIGQQKK